MLKLIATDLDGTLLDENGNIPTEFFSVIKNIVKRNIKFVIASGRPYYTLKKDFESISEHVIFLADNGGTIIENNTITYCNIIDKPLVKRVIQQYRNSTTSYIVLCCKDCAYIESNDEQFLSEINKYFYKIEYVENIETVEADVIKISICDFQNIKGFHEKYFSNKFDESLQVLLSGELWLDIMDSKVNKGTSLQKIQDKNLITSGETMTFGDYYSDIPMFERSYYSYAVENAPEMVKKKAKRLIPSNSESGVVSILKNIF